MAWLLFENRGERRARVFGINIDASGKNALMRDVGAAEIKPALDGKVSLVFDLLRNQLAEDDLLGEIFASDDDALLVVAGGEENDRAKN